MSREKSECKRCASIKAAGGFYIGLLALDALVLHLTGPGHMHAISAFLSFGIGGYIVFLCALCIGPVRERIGRAAFAYFFLSALALFWVNLLLLARHVPH